MIAERITNIIAKHFKVDDDLITRKVKFDAQLDCDETDILAIATLL